MPDQAFRRSLEIKGVTHGSVPIPMGCRVGNMIFSSGIAGRDPATDKVAADAASQARFMFQNMTALVEAGGGSVEHIGHVTIFIKDDAVREPINAEWIKLFPEANNRPARHTLVYNLQHGMLMQLEFTAVLPA